MPNVRQAQRITRRVHSDVTARLERERDGYHLELRQAYAAWERNPTPKGARQIRSLILERIVDACEKSVQSGGDLFALPDGGESTEDLITEMLHAEERTIKVRARRAAELCHSRLAGWDPT